MTILNPTEFEILRITYEYTNQHEHEILMKIINTSYIEDVRKCQSIEIRFYNAFLKRPSVCKNEIPI